MTLVQDESLKVRVSPGTAVDTQGRQIILSKPEEKELTVDMAGKKEIILYIKYAEEKKAQGGREGLTRIVEEPVIDFEKTEESLALATLKKEADGKINIEKSVRQYTGLRLHGGGKNEVTLSYQVEQKSAVLNGNLSITGILNINCEHPEYTSPKITIMSGEGITVDKNNKNNAALHPGISFGFPCGEGISSQRLPVNDQQGNLKGIDIYTNTQRRMSITAEGNVGIGIISPQQKLEVGGNLRVVYKMVVEGLDGKWSDEETATLEIRKGDLLVKKGDVRAQKFYGDGSELTGIMNNIVGMIDGGIKIDQPLNFLNGIDISTKNQPRLSITEEGNVGIGTTTPQEKLEVAGNLRVVNNMVVDGSVSIGTKQEGGVLEIGRGDINVQQGNVRAQKFYGDGSDLTGIMKKIDGMIDGDIKINKPLKLCRGEEQKRIILEERNESILYTDNVIYCQGVIIDVIINNIVIKNYPDGEDQRMWYTSEGIPREIEDKELENIIWVNIKGEKSQKEYKEEVEVYSMNRGFPLTKEQDTTYDHNVVMIFFKREIRWEEEEEMRGRIKVARRVL
ncbi:hypothetical protein [Microcoleus sp. D3_18_C4]|uniref:hypothetical protein n=1 Tax=Microcoleus sp. D3_18_C4 TaxID=3055335 RepID=UPI002FD3A244